jgi:uncharacterized protein YyaL (SSP411 family)
MVWGLIELYETTFELRYLTRAIALTEFTIDRFWDDEAGGFFFTAADGEALIVRPKEVYDGAVPSGNSVAMLNLMRLSRITARTDLQQRAADIGRAFAGQVSRMPSGYTQLMCAVDFLVGPTREVVIAGTEGKTDVRAMRSALARLYAPNKVVVFRPHPGGEEVVEIAPYTREQLPLGGRATAYVCRGYACDLPTDELERMRALVAGD